MLSGIFFSSKYKGKFYWKDMKILIEEEINELDLKTILLH